ncbi:AraC family transcriptional regulator [Sphingomonadaceae bacterium jetA1]|jgi:AraC-like DNA-binding protein|uniref:helix-turn-helix domain-containing protein n=1 Tax=Facivitalis istanbulensis TaxID=3075838 RepID=UPI00349915C2
MEAWLHGGASTLLALAVALFLSAGPSRPARYGAALALSALLAELARWPLAAQWPIVGDILELAGSASLPLFWLFARSWFNDDFRPSVTDLALTIVYLLLNLWQISGGRGPHSSLQPMDGLLYLWGMALTADALRHAWQNRAIDLVEERRRARGAFVVIVTMVAVWTIGAEIFGRTTRAFALADALGATGMLIGMFGLALLLFGLRHPAMFAFADPVAVPAATLATTPAPDAAIDQGLALALDGLMGQERLYRSPDLTIGAIATRLGVPEYRVRRLVNGRFGYRNINDYLNGLRVAEVCEALADHDQAEVPILTIAMDAGFGSLAVFNRAFKARQGETPSAYRRRHLEGAAP